MAPNFRQEKATRESQKGKMVTPHLVTVHLPGIGMRPFHSAKKNMMVTWQSQGSASGGRSDSLLYSGLGLSTTSREAGILYLSTLGMVVNDSSICRIF